MSFNIFKNTDTSPARRAQLFKALAAILLLAALLGLFGCVHSDGEGSTVVIDTGRENAVTAAPFVPTEEPTAIPTETPTAVPTEAPTPEPTQAVNPAGTGKKVYLTFDDGPSKNTPAVLDILARYNIKATFFTIGRMIEKNPNTARRIYEEGHLLACHTQSHDLDKIYKNPDAFLQDVNEWRETVKKTVGSDVGAYYYRFPGGSPSAGGRSGRGRYVEAMNKAGYVGFDWNLAFNDAWLQGNKDDLPVIDYLWKSYEETYSWYKNKQPLIFIIHDTLNESVELLPRAIEDLIAKGYEFCLVSELTDDYLM